MGNARVVANSAIARPAYTPVAAATYPRILGFTHRYTTSVSRFTST